MIDKWMRQNPVDILQYLPAFLKKDENFKAVNDADSKEHEYIRIFLQELFDQFFVDTATWGLDDWEQFINITPRENDDYDTRRQRVKLYLNQHTSSTEKFLENLANNYLTDNSADIIPYNEEYYFELEFNLDALKSLTDLREAINLYKPAHLGFLIAFKILSSIQIKHQAAITQYIDALHNFWNLGTAESTHWDGTYRFDGTIDFSGIKPDSQYKERQSHLLDMIAQIDSHQIITINSTSLITSLIDFKNNLLIDHNLFSTVDIDFKQQSKIEYNALNTGNSSASQSRNGIYKNLMDGSFVMDGSHDFSGKYEFDGLYENRCTITTLDKNGNEIEGSLQIA